MLSVMRQHSRSLLIYVMFGIIIAVFIISFGPGSSGSCVSMSQGYAAKVGNFTVPEQDFRHAIQLLGYDLGGDPAQTRAMEQFMMELLIRRELLAQEAEKLGFRVSDEEIEDRIAQGQILVIGSKPDFVHDGRFAAIYRDGFDYEKFKQSFCTYFLRTTPKRFIDEQRREVLAEKMKEVMRAATKASPEEVKHDYAEKETQVKLNYVRFTARSFDDEINPTPADIAAYVTKNKDKLQEMYKQRSFLYKGAPKQARLRILLVAADKSATPAEVTKAQARAQSLYTKLQGGADFAKLARESSDDAETKHRGGLLGWKSKTSTGLDTVVSDKAFALQKGQTTEPVKADKGFYLVRVEDFREGDLTFDQVAPELAEDLLRKEIGGAKAKAQATAALGKIKAGSKMETLFAKEKGADDIKSDEEEAQSPKTKATGKDKDPLAPKTRETGFFARRGNALEDIGISPEGASQVFATLKKGDVAGPFEVQGAEPTYVVVEVIDRKDPNWETFEKKKDTLTQQFADMKWGSVMNDVTQRRCMEAREAGRIHVNLEVLNGGEGGTFTPCTAFGNR